MPKVQRPSPPREEPTAPSPETERNGTPGGVLGNGRLQVFKFHGVRLTVTSSSSELKAECPFCGGIKFSISLTDTRFNCFQCRTSGNALTFAHTLWESSLQAAKLEDQAVLARRKRIFFPKTLTRWGVCRSLASESWLAPGFKAVLPTPGEGSSSPQVTHLYRSIRNPETNKESFYACPGQDHQMSGVNLFNPKASKVYLCEGIWDAMALWETLGYSKLVEGKLIVTGSEKESLRSDTNVLSVPSCNVFDPNWGRLFTGKQVVLLFDSDHPRVNQKTGTMVPPAGYEGMKCITSHLASLKEEGPSEVLYLHWGEEGYDPNLESGTDLRDLLTASYSQAKRVKALEGILQRIQPTPEAWRTYKRKKDVDIYPVECTEWKTLIDTWKKSMRWTEGLDRALSVMLATVLTTDLPGDQLWCQIVSVPSTGKTVLCEALSVAKKYVVAQSTLRGFHSGYKTDKHGKEDHSLITRVRGKTLIIKDGDTLLSSEKLSVILAEARDLYDRTSRADYLNGVNRIQEGVNMTWLLCGTASLRALDTSELGQRFLVCVIVDSIHEDLERWVNMKKIHEIKNLFSTSGEGAGRDGESKEMVFSKALTGGYVQYLRQNATRLIAAVHLPDETAVKLSLLGTFIAYMRARPSLRQTEEAGREFSTRLVSQLTRLAYALAVTLNKTEVDDEVMRRVTRVAMDTSRGRTLEIAKQLSKVGRTGATVSALVAWTNETDDSLRKILRFLRQIGFAESFNLKEKTTLSSRMRWRLTDRLERLWKDVFAE